MLDDLESNTESFIRRVLLEGALLKSLSGPEKDVSEVEKFEQHFALIQLTTLIRHNPRLWDILLKQVQQVEAQTKPVQSRMSPTPSQPPSSEFTRRRLEENQSLVSPEVNGAS